jgi:DNA-directed RNA polymerase specialized sigma24 family protein
MDKSWLKNIYIDYQNLVYRIAVSIIKDTQLAEDIVQEVFITFYYKGADIRDKNKLKPWLVRTTVNRAIDFSRRFQKVVILPGDYFEQHETNSWSDPTREAEVLGISIGTVKTRLRRARLSMKKHLLQEKQAGNANLSSDEGVSRHE